MLKQRAELASANAYETLELAIFIDSLAQLDFKA